MFRAYGPGPSLWESLLPSEVLRMPAELARVDELLDDPALLEPFVPYFDPRYGRRSIPMEMFLRLMYLKYRYRLGFETLCREVADSVSWRRFCHIPLDVSVPDPSTLKKIAKRCGPAAIEGVNRALLDKAASEKVLRTERVRADTTVVPADVGYPTDSRLLARGVIALVALVACLHSLGFASRTRMRDRSRSVRRRAHEIGAWLRRRSEVAKEEAVAITAQMADIAEASIIDARRVATNARRGVRRAGDHASGKARSALAELEVLIERLDQIVAQTRTRVAGGMPDSASRLVSLHDPDARPIKKGRIGKPVEFGYLAQLVDNADGVVVDHSLHIGNPPDGPLLAPAIERVKNLAGRAPRQVAADRGYGAATVDAELTSMGVKFVAVVRKGRQSVARQAVERSDRFRRLIKWRTGSEGRVSALKRSYGWNRSLMDSLYGTQTWCGYGIFAHNAVKISGLIATTTPKPPTSQPADGGQPADGDRSTRTAGAGPRGHSPPLTLPLSA